MDLCYPSELDVQSLLLKTPHNWVRTWRNQSGTDLVALSLLATFYGSAKFYACNFGKKSHEKCHHAVNPMNYNSDWLGKVCPLVQ